MADQRNESPALGRNRTAASDRLRPQLLTMYRAFMASPERSTLLMLIAAVAVVVVATAYFQVKLNAWNKPFYDALARRDPQAFLDQLLVFATIAIVLLCLNVAQTWLNQMMKLRFRQGLVRNLLDLWLAPGRAFRLAGAGEIGVNPDQRIHEDARHLTELSTDLGIGLFQSSLLLASFIGVLWGVSDGVIFSVNGKAFSIPGYMVWCALLFAATGSWVSWRIGRPLIPLNAERYQRESDLRFGLVRVNQFSDGIALYKGEADEKQHLIGTLDNVLAAMRRLVSGLTRLTWVTAGYGWFAIVAPIMAAAPGYFAGRLSLGELMLAAGAFTQVQQSLRWFVDNFNTIADWLATLRRVGAFRSALIDIGELAADGGQIKRAEREDRKMTFENLRVASPAGDSMLDEAHVEIGPGERVLIVGDSGAGLTTLFRAIAGLWPWGTGVIGLPRSEAVRFMPKHPYMPLGSLREILSYPSAVDAFRDEDRAAACDRVGLADLSAQLDRHANWDSELGDDELQRVGFARLLLHKPRWVCIDQALDALAEVDRASILAIFDKELEGASVISLDRRDPCEGFSQRVLHVSAIAERGAPNSQESRPVGSGAAAP
jgi:vitamin B12/bleomycin/antimicrobial peptide transport system ATP-binding/permease protein